MSKMDKYDFLRDKIQETFSQKQWVEIEKGLREKCKVVFVMWLKIVKKKKLEELNGDEVEEYVREWEAEQRDEEEYVKRWKSALEVEKCDNCVFGVDGEGKVFCLQLAKYKGDDASCADEVVNRGSIYYGRLFELLKLLKVYE